jgi:hypothetical protein
VSCIPFVDTFEFAFSIFCQFTGEVGDVSYFLIWKMEKIDSVDRVLAELNHCWPTNSLYGEDSLACIFVTEKIQSQIPPFTQTLKSHFYSKR